MQVSKKYNIAGLQVLLFLAVYLFVALSYVYFLPSYGKSAPIKTLSASNSIYKRQPQYQGSHTINFLERTDKTIVTEKRKHIFTMVEAVAVAFFLVFLGLDLSGTRLKIQALQYRLFFNRQYAYIPLCTFRI